MILHAIHDKQTGFVTVRGPGPSDDRCLVWIDDLLIAWLSGEELARGARLSPTLTIAEPAVIRVQWIKSGRIGEGTVWSAEAGGNPLVTVIRKGARALLNPVCYLSTSGDATLRRQLKFGRLIRAQYGKIFDSELKLSIQTTETPPEFDPETAADICVTIDARRLTPDRISQIVAETLETLPASLLVATDGRARRVTAAIKSVAVGASASAKTITFQSVRLRRRGAPHLDSDRNRLALTFPPPIAPHALPAVAAWFTRHQQQSADFDVVAFLRDVNAESCTILLTSDMPVEDIISAMSKADFLTFNRHLAGRRYGTISVEGFNNRHLGSRPLVYPGLDADVHALLSALAEQQQFRFISPHNAPSKAATVRVRV